MAAPIYNVFVGAETGLLKGVDCTKKAWGNLNQLAAADRQHEITAMCWGDDNFSEMCVGSRNRMVSILDMESLEFTSSCHLPGGKGVFKGLAKINGCFVTAVDSGLVTLWDEDRKNVQTTVETGEDLFKMRQNPEAPHLIATGGKENELKIWDFTNPDKPIFTAKNVREDWLRLRVPVWVTDMAFVAGSEKIVTVTGHHQMRMYDPSTSQRRPVIDVEFDEYPITSVSLRPNHNQVVIGNTQGKMALMDLRKGQMVQCYKGFAGSIREIVCHPSAPVVASCSLDRHLRIHHIESRELLNKFYLKSRLNCMLLTDKWGDDEENGDNAEKHPSATNGEEKSENGEDDDDVWDNMEQLEEKSKAVKNKAKKSSKKKEELKRQREDDTEEPESEDDEPVAAPTVKKKKSGKKKKKQLSD